MKILWLMFKQLKISYKLKNIKRKSDDNGFKIKMFINGGYEAVYYEDSQNLCLQHPKGGCVTLLKFSDVVAWYGPKDFGYDLADILNSLKSDNYTCSNCGELRPEQVTHEEKCMYCGRDV